MSHAIASSNSGRGEAEQVAKRKPFAEPSGRQTRPAEPSQQPVSRRAFGPGATRRTKRRRGSSPSRVMEPRNPSGRGSRRRWHGRRPRSERRKVEPHILPARRSESCRGRRAGRANAGFPGNWRGLPASSSKVGRRGVAEPKGLRAVGHASSQRSETTRNDGPRDRAQRGRRGPAGVGLAHSTYQPRDRPPGRPAGGKGRGRKRNRGRTTWPGRRTRKTCQHGERG